MYACMHVCIHTYVRIREWSSGQSTPKAWHTAFVSILSGQQGAQDLCPGVREEAR